jgi:hypothetical protein
VTIPDPTPAPPLPAAIERKIALAALQAETERAILERYPEHTQRNLALRGGEEAAQAIAWIDEQRAAYRRRKAQIEA